MGDYDLNPIEEEQLEDQEAGQLDPETYEEYEKYAFKDEDTQRSKITQLLRHIIQ